MNLAAAVRRSATQGQAQVEASPNRATLEGERASSGPALDGAFSDTGVP